MAEGNCAKCSKFFLIVFNLLLWITGGTMLGLGVYILVSNEMEGFLKNLIDINIPLEFMYTAAYILVAVGAFVFMAGFCGCCGAIRESACMLGVYIICIAIVIGGEVAAGIYVSVERGSLEQSIRGKMLDAVQNYTDHGSSTMDSLQITLHCCGADNYTDYWKVTFPKPDQHVPDSCCRRNNTVNNTAECQREASESMPVDPEKFEVLRAKGCFTTILTWINNHSVVLIGVAVGIAAFQILGIVFAVVLCRNRSEYYDD